MKQTRPFKLSMKAGLIVSSLATVLFFSSCNNGTDETDEPQTYDEVGVPNVNGNMPDTTNTISIGTETDSTKTYDSTTER